MLFTVEMIDGAIWSPICYNSDYSDAVGPCLAARRQKLPLRLYRSDYAEHIACTALHHLALMVFAREQARLSPVPVPESLQMAFREAERLVAAATTSPAALGYALAALQRRACLPTAQQAPTDGVPTWVFIGQAPLPRRYIAHPELVNLWQQHQANFATMVKAMNDAIERLERPPASGSAD